MRLNLVIKVALPALAPKHDSPLHFTGSEDASDGRCQAPPLAGFMDQLFSSCPGEEVEAGLAIVVAGAPFGANPATGFQSLQGRVERTVIHQQLVPGKELDGARNTWPCWRPKSSVRKISKSSV